jgi:hypothetical protein
MGFVIQGTNFGNSATGSTTKVGTTTLTVLAWTDQSITVQLPISTPTGNTPQPLVVTVGGHDSNNNFSFKVTPPLGCP